MGLRKHELQKQDNYKRQPEARCLRLRKSEPLRRQAWYVGLVTVENLKWSEELANRLELQVECQPPHPHTTTTHTPIILHPAIPLGGNSHGLCQSERALWGLGQSHNNNITDKAADADMPIRPAIKAHNS